MLNRVALAAVIALALAGEALPTTAHADEGSNAPHASGAFSALSPDPDGTADTVVPGEHLQYAEVDARIGWLVQTYIMDARAALRRDQVHEAVETLARARSALSALGQRSEERTHDLKLPTSLAASLTQARVALSADDRAGADRALAYGERRLQTALVDLDAELHPQSGPPLE